MTLIIAVFALYLGSCSHFPKQMIEKPKVAIKRVNLRDIDDKGATLVFVLDVFNPNSFALKVDALTYNIELDGKKLAEGELEKPADVAANSESSIDVPVPVQFEQLFSSVLDFALKGKSLYRITGDARFGLIRIPFANSGELSLRK